VKLDDFVTVEPAAQVTIEQEIETLKLYLEIEKMRFEDRLRPSFDVHPSVAHARLPSLLLQPLVENAIKYAVTPKEEGAEISVSAQPAGENVRIVVSDSGPGLNDGAMKPHIPVSEGTGVGLPNIRDRLIQAFGERQRFETRSTQSGFSVIIEIPLNMDETSKVAA
jgi:LytS/YehU family sensor histidine kinase